MLKGFQGLILLHSFLYINIDPNTNVFVFFLLLLVRMEGSELGKRKNMVIFIIPIKDHFTTLVTAPYDSASAPKLDSAVSISFKRETINRIWFYYYFLFEMRKQDGVSMKL